MDRNCLIGIGILAGVIVIIVLAFLDYKGKMTRKSITLEKNDLKHAEKHKHNEHRINELEKNNGHEQRQIDELKKDNGELKDMIIKLQEKIIRDGKRSRQ